MTAQKEQSEVCKSNLRQYGAPYTLQLDRKNLVLTNVNHETGRVQIVPLFDSECKEKEFYK